MWCKYNKYTVNTQFFPTNGLFMPLVKVFFKLAR